MKYYYKLLTSCVFVFLFNACATYKTQLKKGVESLKFSDKEIEHTFYLIGDAGNSEIGTSSTTLQSFKKELSKASKNSTAIFLGDNIYPAGMPNGQGKEKTNAENVLLAQLELLQDLEGHIYFIPGHAHNFGLEGESKINPWRGRVLGEFCSEEDHMFFPEGE